MIFHSKLSLNIFENYTRKISDYGKICKLPYKVFAYIEIYLLETRKYLIKY